MVDRQEKNTTAFDPLAWMNEESVEVEIPEKQTELEHVSDDEEKEGVNELEEQTLNESKVTLDSTLNIQHVGELYERLLTMLDQQNKIEIDASAVVAIDTASLQLLVVLKQTAIKAQKQVTIDFPSDQFIEAARLLGLSSILEVEQAAAGLF